MIYHHQKITIFSRLIGYHHQKISTKIPSIATALQQLALLLRLLRARGTQRGDRGADGADEGRENAHGEPRGTGRPRHVTQRWFR